MSKAPEGRSCGIPHGAGGCSILYIGVAAITWHGPIADCRGRRGTSGECIEAGIAGPGGPQGGNLFTGVRLAVLLGALVRMISSILVFLPGQAR